MGLVDSLGAEDRVEVKYSDFYKLVRAEAERTLLKNAVHAGVSREQILKMLSGQNDELEEYRKTGLTPEQIFEMDHLYADKCKEVAITNAEKDVLAKQLEDLMKEREKEETAAAEVGGSATQEEKSETEDAGTDKKNGLEREVLIRVRSSL